MANSLFPNDRIYGESGAEGVGFHQDRLEPESNGWYDLREGHCFEGGRDIKVDAPYSDTPVFVREGSIVPFGPSIQYSTDPGELQYSPC